MNYLQEDWDELKQVCDYVNQNNDTYPLLLLYGLSHLKASPTRTEIEPNFFVPTSIEAMRILLHLRRRMDASDTKNHLVSQIRTEIRPRLRPERNVTPQTLSSPLDKVAKIAGQKEFSQFQVEGWQKVLQTLKQASQNQAVGMVITAPTGAGKTEVFLTPLIYQIASALANAKNSSIPRFAIIYPRIALAQDQIVRTFRYAEQATQQFGLSSGRQIIIGFQFTGIWSKRENTLKDTKVFRHNGSNYEFLLLDTCPWCTRKTRLTFNAYADQTYLECPRCRKKVCVSISKDDHRDIQPHLLLTTAESLDRMYLDWDFKEYLPLLHGIILDEAHLFNQVYGSHIHRLLQRLRSLIKTNNRELAFIASSATIADSTDFAQRLFFGSTTINSTINVVDADNYPKVLSGLETFYFLQAPNGRYGKSQALSTMIQTIMAMGHGIINSDKRMIVFAESLDIAGRLRIQIEDAEDTKQLWGMRVDLNTPRLTFKGFTCPKTSPLSCSNIYMDGECWRGALGGYQCYNSLPILRTRPIPIQIITGNTQGQRSFQYPIIIGTSALEVGIDDSTVQATLHYRPPRTVFDFIQRRGRAGRQPGDSAYTVVVLGKKPSDYYYLTRRHRLIDGKYELPLNPDNPVVKDIHIQLENARKEAFSLISKHKEQLGIWKWILSNLQGCSEIQNKYSSELYSISQSGGVDKQQQRLKEWIENGLNEAKGQVSVDWEIPQRKKQISHPALLVIIDDLINKFNEWLDNNLSDADFTRELTRLQGEAATFVQQIQTGSYSIVTLTNEYSIVFQSILEVQALAQKSRANVKNSIQSGKAWYEFFSRLQHLFENYNLIVLAGAIKVVYQSLYLLHQGLPTHACSIPVYVPDNYFGGLLQMRVEIAGDRIASEPINFLSSVFAPYRLNYRYEEDILYTLDTRTLGTLRTDQVRLKPSADGPQFKDPKDHAVIHVRSIRLRKLKGDSLQNLGVCQRCMQLYDLQRQSTTCQCGGSIKGGRVYPIKNYIDNGFESDTPIPIASTFALIPSLKVWTTVRGTNVSFTPNDGSQAIQFRAWLNPSIYYELPTKGIQWELPGNPSEEVLLSAANLLHKTMASIVGVREDKLVHSYDVETGAVLVWETSEGGAGLCEIFADILQKNPLQIYLEMVATVACPIYLAEQHKTLWQSQTELVEYLAGQFNLPNNEQLLSEIAAEAHAEIQHRDTAGHVCNKFDGCPACIQSSQVSDSDVPKRSLAWQLTQSLVQKIPTNQWTSMISQTPAPVIRVDMKRGLYYVLVL